MTVVSGSCKIAGMQAKVHVKEATGIYKRCYTARAGRRECVGSVENQQLELEVVAYWCAETSFASTNVAYRHIVNISILTFGACGPCWIAGILTHIIIYRVLFLSEYLSFNNSASTGQFIRFFLSQCFLEWSSNQSVNSALCQKSICEFVQLFIFSRRFCLKIKTSLLIVAELQRARHHW